MNVAIEELVRNRFELPGFTTLLKEARRGRTEVNRGLYRRVAHALGDEGREQLDRLLTVDSATRRSPRNAVREDAGRPTLTHLKHLVDRLQWLKPLNVGVSALGTIAQVEQILQDCETHAAYTDCRFPNDNANHNRNPGLLILVIESSCPSAGSSGSPGHHLITPLRATRRRRPGSCR